MEFLTLIQGLEPAQTQSLRPLEVCIDSKEVINMLYNGNMLYDSILDECRLLIRSLGGPAVQHNFREQIRIADALGEKGPALKSFGRP